MFTASSEWDTETLEIPATFANFIVSASGEYPSGHTQTNSKGSTDANLTQELTILFPSPI